MFIISILVLLCDQLSKFFVLKKIPYGTSIPIINNIFHLTLVKNSGSAFGFLKDAGIVFVIMTAIAVVFISGYLLFKRNSLDSKIRIALFLILGGALGNLIDRIRFGYVIDFLDFRIWPVFNLADSCITIAVVLIGLQIITAKNTLTSTKR